MRKQQNQVLKQKICNIVFENMTLKIGEGTKSN